MSTEYGGEPFECQPLTHRCAVLPLPASGERAGVRGKWRWRIPTPTKRHMPCHAKQWPPVPCIQCIASIQSTFPIHAPCPWLKWYGVHDGLEPAEGSPEVVGVASATEIYGTNPKSV